LKGLQMPSFQLASAYLRVLDLACKHNKSQEAFNAQMSQYAHAMFRDNLDWHLMQGAVGSVLSDEKSPGPTINAAMVFTKLGSTTIVAGDDSVEAQLKSALERLKIKRGIRFLVQCSVDTGTKERQIVGQFIASESKNR